jgi:hypothetical protein
MKPWKAAEYSAAKKLGGKRIALSGGRGASAKGDVELPGWLVEVKYRKLFAVMTMFLEVERKARKEGKNALLILKERGNHGELAVMRIEYFKELPKYVKGGKDESNMRTV